MTQDTPPYVFLFISATLTCVSTRTPLEREVARLLEEARLDLGLSQAEVADRAARAGYEINQVKVSRVLRGTHAMNLTDAAGIAAALGMRLSTVLQLAEGERAETVESVDVDEVSPPRRGPGSSAAQKRRPRRVTAVPPEA